MLQWFKSYQYKKIPFLLLLSVWGLNYLGILLIGSAKSSVQSTQITGMIIGSVAMLVVACVDYSFLMKLHWFIYVIALGLLGAVLLYGKTSGGAQRWLTIAGIQFQPAELVKIMLILFFAWFFGKYRGKINHFLVLLTAAVLIGIPLVLIVCQPALTTTILTTLIFLAMIFIAGPSFKLIGGFQAIVVPAGAVVLLLVLTSGESFLKTYQLNRILDWVYPTKYATNAYQQQNSITAIASGQLLGKGLNNDSVYSLKNGNFIPELHTDFIFSVAGEELGFVGCLGILILLLLIVLECIMIGRRAKDIQGGLLCGGVAAMIGFQAFVNICVVTGLMPNTGVTLPFVSYGLTSLISLYIAFGLVINVALQPKQYRTGDDYL